MRYSVIQSYSNRNTFSLRMTKNVLKSNKCVQRIEHVIHGKFKSNFMPQNCLNVKAFTGTSFQTTTT